MPVARGGRTGDPAEPTTTRSLRGLQATGIDGGVWCGDGSPADFALDQRPDDGASLCWDSAPLTERVELLGNGEAALELSVDRPWALVAVRVCDVAPDGASTLIARGLLNLSRREGHRPHRADAAERAGACSCSAPVDGVCDPGRAPHPARGSNTYWPMAWPSPEPSTLTVVGGSRSVLSLPRRRSSELDAQLRPFAAPESGTPLASEKTMLRDGGRQVRRNLHNGEIEVEFDWHAWRTRILATGTEMGEQNVTTYRVVEGDPLSATVTCQVEVSLARPGWDTRTVAASTMTCEAERFIVTTSLEGFQDGVRVHARTYAHHFSRDGT